MKPLLQYAAGIIFSLCLMIVLLFTSVEAAIYWVPGYFEKEYTKYNVTQSVSMTMADLLEVTGEMMSYLRGKREDLHIETTINGVEREFFNTREIDHMKDVRSLFISALIIRRGCLTVMALCLILLALLKTDFNITFPRAVCMGTGLFFSLSVFTAIIISADFTRYFILFHHIFFNNDLWMLDPSTDMLINIVPEGFFRDTVFFIGFIFLFSILLILFLCLFLMRRRAETVK